MLQLYIWSFVLRAEYILNQLARRIISRSNKEKVESKKEYIFPQRRYTILKASVKFLIIHSSKITITALSAIALAHASIPNFVLVSLHLFNILLTEFGIMENKLRKKMRFMSVLFSLTQFCILCFLGVYACNQLPFDGAPYFKWFMSAGFVDKIVIFIILQLYMDLINSEAYQTTYEKALEKTTRRVKNSY